MPSGSYTPTNWQAGVTPLSEANLDHLETQHGLSAYLTVAETEVFSGAAPVAWTDLDLSAVVGANYALVLLKIAHSAQQYAYAVRKNGDTDDFFVNDTSISPGVAQSFTPTGGAHHVVLLVATDSAGVIEWIGSNASVTTTVDVIAYIT